MFLICSGKINRIRTATLKGGPLSSSWLRGLLVAAGLIAIAGAGAAELRRTVAGPVRAHLVRVVDGDTIEVLARIWPDHYVETLVRLADIDAPELRGRCAQEIVLAERAKARLAALLVGNRLQLTDVHYGKYAGRVVRGSRPRMGATWPRRCSTKSSRALTRRPPRQLVPGMSGKRKGRPEGRPSRALKVFSSG